MTNICIEDKNLFFHYLKVQVFNECRHAYILELAHSVIESQSRLLVQEYSNRDTFKQFLVSMCFDYDNPYNVNGVKGSIFVNNNDIGIDVIDNNSLVTIPNMSEIDTLLVQGMQSDVMSLVYSKYNKLFGDVIEESDLDKKKFYESIYKLICNSSTNDYQLCHDRVSELGKELYLIKRR